MRIIIIGAGVIGMFSAYELRRAGLQVTLIDRGPPGKHSSWAGGGILYPVLPWQFPRFMFPLITWSIDFYRSFCEDLASETGIDPEFVSSGALFLGHGQDAEALDFVRSEQIKAEHLDAQKLRFEEPNLSPQGSAALRLPEVAQIRNPRLIKAMMVWLRDHGVEIMSEAEVTGFDAPTPRHVQALHTTMGKLSADAFVLAAGAWSGDWVARHLHQPLAISPVRGQILLYHRAPGYLRHIVLSPRGYLIPRKDGSILCGSTQERVGFDSEPTDEAALKLADTAAFLLPELGNQRPEAHWAGLRPGSINGIPYIDRHPGFDNLYINSGHFRNGLLLAPASACLLADIILKRDSAPFSADPFRLYP